MYRCSYFIEGKALFGSYPSQEDVNELEAQGVRYFFDLTCKDEINTVPYVTKYNYIKYPIFDRKIPSMKSTFATLVLNTCNIIKKLQNNEKIYVHCKGGHGRSGILVACVLSYYKKISPTYALYLTSKYHSQRENLHKKWLKHGAPHGKYQKFFVHNFLKELRYSTKNFFQDFCDISPHKVTIPKYGVFNTAKDAVDFMKNIIQNREECLYTVLKYKIEQHSYILENLLDTGLRRLILHSKDPFYGNAYNDSGENTHGKVLMRIRDEYLCKDLDYSKFL